MLLFREWAGLAFVCVGFAEVIAGADTSLSCSGEEERWLVASLTSLLLLKRTLDFFGGFSPALPDLLGFSKDSALGCSDEL